jgi:hypothetical protein
MSMQLSKPVEKAKEWSKPPVPVQLSASECLRAAVNKTIVVTASDIGERLREGVQRRLQEHAAMRKASSTVDTSTEEEEEEEDSPVTPRECLQQFC